MTARAPTSDWIVVGGGIVGTACAYYLAADHQRVTLIERGGIANGTTRAGQNNIGIPLAAGEAIGYFEAAAEEYRRLLALGLDLDHRRHGHLYVARDPHVAADLRAAADGLRLAGVSVRVLTGRELRTIEPRLARSIELAAFLPDGAQVSPMRTALELAAAAARLGAHIVTGTEVTDVTQADGRFVSVATTRGRFDAGGIVVAAGVWSRQVGAFVGVDLPVLGRRGHILVTEPAPDLLSHGVIDFGFDRALAEGADGASPSAAFGAVIQPLPSGNLLVGGSIEDTGLERIIDRASISRVAEAAMQVMPDLGSLRTIRAYSGVRPATPDGRPLVGFISEVQGVMLATGHGGGGIDGGPLAGRLIADLVAGRRLPDAAAGLDPRRLRTSIGPASPGATAATMGTN